MDFGPLGGSAVRCGSRSGRPRPVSFHGIVAFLSCCGSLRPYFNQPSDGGAGGGRGAGSDGGEDAEAKPVHTKAANIHVGKKQIHSNDNKNDDIQQLNPTFSPSAAPWMTYQLIYPDIQQLKLDLGEVRLSNASIVNYVRTLAYYAMRNGTGTPENKDAEDRMKGLLGSMLSMVDKLPVYCGGAFILFCTLYTANSSAPKAGQNFDGPWIQVMIIGSFILCITSNYVISLASKFKDSNSIDGVLFQFYMWLLLLVFLTFFLGICVGLHFVVHISGFIVCPVGILILIVSLSFWYFVFYKEWKQILELKKKHALGSGMSPEHLEDEAAHLERENSHTV